jgi:predicted patatin/cPLA2 family phospholipase
MDDKCNALVVEGGAMRGIFSTGVLDVSILKQDYDYGYETGTKIIKLWEKETM